MLFRTEPAFCLFEFSFEALARNQILTAHRLAAGDLLNSLDGLLIRVTFRHQGEYAENSVLRILAGADLLSIMAFTLNGCGTTFYGQREFHSDGTYVTTEWIVMIYIPLVPLRSMRVRYTGPSERSIKIGFGGPARGYTIYEKTWPNWRQVACTYGLVAATLGWIWGVCLIGDSFLEKNSSLILPMLATAVILPALLPRFLRTRARRHAAV